jgi:hypothetical protein
MPEPPYVVGPFQDIVNVHWGSSLYAVFWLQWPDNQSMIVELVDDDNGKPKAKLVANIPMNNAFGTLRVQQRLYVLKVPANAGEFVRFNSFVKGFDGYTIFGNSIAAWLLPEQVKASDITPNRLNQANPFMLELPFIWYIYQMNMYDSCVTTFAIRKENHLMSGDGVIAELWPTTGKNKKTYAGGYTAFNEFYVVTGYRTDQKGEGTIYGRPREWSKKILSGSPPDVFAEGLPIGSSPPLISVDVPYVKG